MSDNNAPKPSPASYATPAVKRLKSESSSSILTSGPVLPPSSNNSNVTGGGNAAQGGGAPSSSVDPEMLSDALLSAGVDLKEEESFLSRSLYGTGSSRPAGTSGPGGVSSTGGSLNGSGAGETLDKGTGPAPLPPALERIYKYQQEHQGVPFLDPGRLQLILDNEAQDAGLNLPPDAKEMEAILALISYACQEWVSDVVTSALVLSRHRRRSRNNVHSDVSRALRSIAQTEKEVEDKRLARKAVLLGDNESDNENEKPSKKDKSNEDGDGDGKGKRGRGAANDEINYSAANATVNMMTLGSKRKYSWLTEGAGGGGASGGAATTTHRATGSGLRSDGSVRYREAREEQGLVVRDLLAALEHQRTGVINTVMKGYAKLRH